MAKNKVTRTGSTDQDAERPDDRTDRLYGSLLIGMMVLLAGFAVLVLIAWQSF